MTSSTPKISGVYRAIVTDTNCFKTTGKIKTRISIFNNYFVEYNLLDRYNSSNYEEELSKDTDTLILMPFGGGDNFGMFKLPEVNSIGVVTFIDGNKNLPLWLGGMPAFYTDNLRNVTSVSYPLDNIDNNGAIYTQPNGKTVYNFYDEHSFVIKTKTTTLDDYSNPDTMNWKSIPVENSLIMNKNTLDMRHIIDSDSYQQIVFNSDGESNNSSFRTVLKDASKEVTINDDMILIKNSNNGHTTKIIMDDDGNLRLSSTDNSSSGAIVESDIFLSPAKITMSAGNSKISFDRTLNSNNDSITISAQNVVLNASKISLGPSGYRLVATPNSNMAITLEDGTMLTTIDNITV